MLEMITATDNLSRKISVPCLLFIILLYVNLPPVRMNGTIKISILNLTFYFENMITGEFI